MRSMLQSSVIGLGKITKMTRNPINPNELQKSCLKMRLSSRKRTVGHGNPQPIWAVLNVTSERNQGPPINCP